MCLYFNGYIYTKSNRLFDIFRYCVVREREGGERFVMGFRWGFRFFLFILQIHVCSLFILINQNNVGYFNHLLSDPIGFETQ